MESKKSLYYYNNKEKVANRQQTEEYRARARELYKERMANISEEEHEAKLVRYRELSKIRRKKQKEELKAKYPGLKLYEAKALEKAKRTNT
jgi:uncharacterized membrane protein